MNFVSENVLVPNFPQGIDFIPATMTMNFVS